MAEFVAGRGTKKNKDPDAFKSRSLFYILVTRSILFIESIGSMDIILIMNLFRFYRMKNGKT